MGNRHGSVALFIRRALPALLAAGVVSACRSDRDETVDFTVETERRGELAAAGESFRRAEYRRFALRHIPGSAWRLSLERQEPDLAIWSIEDKQNPLHTVVGVVDFIVPPAETVLTTEGLLEMVEGSVSKVPPGHRLISLDTQVLGDDSPLPGVRYRCTSIDERVSEIPWIVVTSGYMMLDGESPGKLMLVLYSERDRKTPEVNRGNEYAFFNSVLIRTPGGWTPLLSPRTVAPVRAAKPPPDAAAEGKNAATIKQQ